MGATEGFMKAQIEQLEKENKKLKLENADLMGERDGLKMVVDKLREELSIYDREYYDEDKKAENIFIGKRGKVIKGGKFTTLC